MKTKGLCNATVPIALITARSTSAVESVQVVLGEGAVWASKGKHTGISLHVLAGRIWLTVEGDSRDYLVRQGETFQTSARGRIVAQGIGPNSRMHILG